MHGDSCQRILKCPAAAMGDMEFVMSMSTSNVTPTYQIDPEQQLRIKARYNATVRHTGALFYAALCSLMPSYAALRCHS